MSDKENDKSGKMTSANTATPDSHTAMLAKCKERRRSRNKTAPISLGGTREFFANLGDGAPQEAKDTNKPKKTVRFDLPTSQHKVH